MSYQDPKTLAERVHAMLSDPTAFEVAVEEMGKGGKRVRIRSLVTAVRGDVLPRAQASIEIVGAGRFILRLDDVMSIDEIYDHDDDGVLEVVSDFCAIAENYLGGDGTITQDSRHVSIVSAAGDDQYLLEGRLRTSEVM